MQAPCLPKGRDECLMKGYIAREETRLENENEAERRTRQRFVRKGKHQGGPTSNGNNDHDRERTESREKRSTASEREVVIAQ